MTNEDMMTATSNLKTIKPNLKVKYPSITKKVTPSKTNILEKQE